MKETTFSLIKPNAMKKQKQGEIISKILESGLQIVGLKLQKIPRSLCEMFYEEHQERAFYSELVNFITSAPVILMAIQGESAVKKMRDIMGDTDPSKAKDGTLRKIYGDNIGENAIHGSDSLKSAERELRLFFKQEELV